MSTTVPAVKAKLVELFTAAVTDTTEVWPSRTNADHQQAENIYIGDVRGSRKFVNLAGGSPGSREENYEVLVEVEVYRDGTDGPGTEARMWELVDAIELPIALKPTIEDIGGQWAIAGRFDQSITAGQDGFLAKYILGVEVTARV